MKALVLAVVLVALGHGAADARPCKRKGSVLIVETLSPLRDATIPTATLTIYATGAWITDDGTTKTTGCLARGHLKELKRTLAKAQFALDTSGMGTCKALSTTQVELRSPKRRKSVTFARPCGTPTDEWTTNLVVCAELAGSKTATGEIRMLCRGQDPPL